MPTGYTADLYAGKDVSFETFTLHCARAMGAAILMRDDPPGPIDPAKVADGSSYYDRELVRLRAERDETLAWTADEAEAAAEKAYREVVESNERAEAKRVALFARYEDMLAKVRAWVPPTPDHVGLKDFMVEQLESSIEFDCSVYEIPAERLAGIDFQEKRLDELVAGIERAEKHAAEERERNAGRVAWTFALVDSFDSVSA